jgi:hypothetical protein
MPAGKQERQSRGVGGTGAARITGSALRSARTGIASATSWSLTAMSHDDPPNHDTKNPHDGHGHDDGTGHH